ncbi:AAA family ATPase [Mesorhizobium kowhaii]|uniref:histidine kinase n=1 Tax=Mesorhizobium kowhaii TaxID=1300272 RepID=A0A2W7BT13_9HYPH|nr:AAA family ATPase [Mesorhizobium kowhaii]PZV33990.1 histidine kinase [Mesorhizobium kowhaii]
MDDTVQGVPKRRARKVKNTKQGAADPGQQTIQTGVFGGHLAVWDEGDRIFTRQVLQDQKAGPQPVLIVRLAAELPTLASLDRLAHEYALRDELDSAWAAKPLAFNKEAGHSTLVLEDCGGVPLSQLLAPRKEGMAIELSTFLRLAIGITAAVGKVHERGLIHRDIKPANILVNEADCQVRLTGFGLASRLTRERQAPEPPEVIAGTLAYMAPEQTGRMNRSVDSRSDLYSTGVTFYEMVTGRLPFSAADPMEWVHCHIARRPVPPSEAATKVPRAVSAIVMKLLAKNAEERYQTADGLEADLRRALTETEGRGWIEEFPIAAQDLPDKLLIPEQPYGREGEIAILLAAFDRVVAAGGPELVLVSGPAGTGKSTVVNELHRALVPSRGLFASGKFDQNQRDVPYASLAQALQGLFRPLLGKSDAELDPWRSALSAALGFNGGLMVTLVPDLELLIGPQPPVAELAPQDAKRRFHLIVRRLLAVFARPEHPLALFLDDLQWLDAATLDLLEDLTTHPEVRHLLLIGAYRDDEVPPTHPLIRRLTAIREAGGRVHQVGLTPLRLTDVSRMLADALHCESNRVLPLARLVHKKSAGNPFFALQFILALPEEGLLGFDRAHRRWDWDLEGIRGKGYADNVADLMLGKLRRLPASTQRALHMLACLGNRATIDTLTMIRGESDEAVHAAFWAAVRAGLVLREEVSYRFLHDRVQEAAYALVPEDEQVVAHLAIGRLLLARTPLEALADRIFEIVGHLNRGTALIVSGKERERLADLNLAAARRARSSAAYTSALTYADLGGALLPDDAWDRRYELAFALGLLRAECLFLTGSTAEAEARLAPLSRRATSLTDLARVTRLRVDLSMSLGRSDLAILVGLDYLHRVGIRWTAHPTRNRVRREYTRLFQQLGDRPIEALLDLPSMADPVALATMDVLTSLVTPALFTDENLRCLVIGRMGNVSLKYGNSDTTPYAYTAVGTVLGPYFGKYEVGFRFGLLGLDLVEQPGMDRLKARVYLAFGNLAKSSPRHVRTGRALAGRVFDTAQQVGDLTYAVLSRNNLLTYLLAGGEPLSEVERDAQAGLDFARQAGFGVVVGFIAGQLQLVRTLRGLTPVFGCFNDTGFDEFQFERDIDGRPGSCLYWIRKLQARWLAGEYVTALAAASKAQGLLWMTPAIFERAEYHFYAGLSLAALCDEVSATDSSQHRKDLRGHRRQLEEWSKHCPENFGSRAALLGAESARLDKRTLDAERLYEQAAQLARTNLLPNDEAIAYDRASAFYRRRGFDQIAALYLQNARRSYQRWGADGKVRQLDELFPQLRNEETAAAATGTIEAPVEHLDLATVIKVSQAVSGEIVLERLIETVLRIALEQAGGERGLLIGSQGSEPRLMAEASTNGNAIEVDLRDEPLESVSLPGSVLRYVMRTKESVILDSTTSNEAFAEDPYLIQHPGLSILCMPLLNQSVLSGVLYVENNLASRVFAPARMAVLKILASQAATALVNTGLYRDLEEREGRIRRLVEANIIGIFIRDIDGRIVEANEAFLSMVGYGRDDLLGGRLSSAQLTTEEWRDRDAEAEAELKAVGSVQPFEKEYRRKDGSRVPVLIGEASFEGSANQAVAFVLDLSERKRGEEKLRASESRFRTFVDHATDAFFLHTDDLTVIDVNRQACEGLGYSREELIGMHPREFDGGLDQEALATVVNQVDSGQTTTFETLHRRKDGTVFPVEIRAGRFQLGHEWLRLSLVRDITDRKQAENALQLAQAELAHVSRLTMMGELAASIAHEVRQPLTGLVGSGNAALRYLDADPRDIISARRAVERMVSDAFRASEVIDRIRAMAKKSPERREWLSINEVVLETIALITTDLQRATVSLTTKLSNNLPVVLGDQVQIQQVILNLLMNAKDAMAGNPIGSRELSISTEQLVDDTIMVAVRDSGPRIDSAKIEEMFEAFYSSKPKGMGLGLTISRSIIEAHNGKLWAVPNGPRGAIFQFTLPVEGKSQ